MAKKKFKVNILSSSSIEQLKKDLIAYRDSLPGKCKLLTERLAQKGIIVAQARIDESPLGKYVSVNVNINPDKIGCKAVIVSTGAVMQQKGYDDFNILLAIEFGAGIYYNATPNPNADKFGLGVGTFPGQIHAFEKGWYYWDDAAQQWKFTHGVKATMPMHEATQEIIREIVNTAKEVFA